MIIKMQKLQNPDGNEFSNPVVCWETVDSPNLFVKLFNYATVAIYTDKF